MLKSSGSYLCFSWEPPQFARPESVVGQSLPKMSSPHHVRFSPDSDRRTDIADSPVRADIVAKVFLRGGTQILRPVGAAIE